MATSPESSRASSRFRYSIHRRFDTA